MELKKTPELCEWTQSRVYGPGQTILLEGEPSRMVYQVVRGAVKCARNSASGREVIVGLAFPGDFLDVAASLDGQPYGLTASSLQGSEVELVAVPRERALACQSLAEHLERCLLSELRWQRSVASAMALERVEVRALQALEMLGRRIGETTAEGLRFPMLLTRQELASLIGTTTETCIRILSRLRSEGLLQEADGVLSLSQKALVAA
jgi:CRP/FNR family transcriptional regulator